MDNWSNPDASALALASVEVDIAAVQPGMSLTVNYSAMASNVAFGTASSYGEVPSSTNSIIDVTNPLALSSVYTASAVTLSAGAVYTVFILMGTKGPVGLLRRER